MDQCWKMLRITCSCSWIVLFDYEMHTKIATYLLVEKILKMNHKQNPVLIKWKYFTFQFKNDDIFIFLREQKHVFVIFLYWKFNYAFYLPAYFVKFIAFISLKYVKLKHLFFLSVFTHFQQFKNNFHGTSKAVVSNGLFVCYTFWEWGFIWSFS